MLRRERGGVLDVIVVGLAVLVVAMIFLPQRQFDRAFLWLAQMGLTEPADVSVDGRVARPTVPPDPGPRPERPRVPAPTDPDPYPYPVPRTVPGQLPFCEDVTGTETACQWRDAAAGAAAQDTVVWRGVDVPATSTECDTVNRFYTCAEMVAMEAEAAKFYDPSTLPTAPPEFVEYMRSACATATVKSVLCP